MKPRVLIICNAYKDIEVLKLTLEKQSYSVIISSGSKEAVEIVLLNEIDLILLEVDFFECSKDIKSIVKLSDIPLMLISADNNNYTKLMDFINNIDQLTGIHNRDYFNSKIIKFYNDAIDNDYDLSVVMMDMDFFREVNNSKGHLAGNKILSKVAEIIKFSIRDEDLVVRFGGEEFAFVFFKVSALMARSIVKRIGKAIQDELNITASFGVTELKKSDSIEGFIDRADKALYEAKDKGRNKAVIL